MLCKNSNDRCSLLNGSGIELRELTCGCGIEVLLDEDDEVKWFATRVESDANDYCLVGASSYSMEGFMGKVR